jgi:tetratricopeptide (TPR) repeat protein
VAMSKNLNRFLGIFALALAASLASGPRPVEATCGGGGGGGMGGSGSGSSSDSSGKGEPTYNTSWVGTVSEAVDKVKNARKAVILYFVPENNKGTHPFFRTKMMADISADHGAVRIVFAKDSALREEYKVPKDKELHYLVVCDWFANPIKPFTATATSKFNFPAMDSLLKQLQPTVNQILKKLEGNLKNAEAKLEKDDAVEALKAMGDLVTLKGHDLVEKAKPAIQKIEEAANAEIAEALKIEDKKARAEKLKKIRTRYKNLKSVEDKCDKEVEAATGMAPAREEDPALVRGEFLEAADALIASIDFSKRAPSISERAHQAMVDGLNCEIREEYEKALDHYARACGLDPRDSVALAYLGELYRHHLGRWDEARRTFDRVVELNNNRLAMAVALHGLGKMTIWEGNNERGLQLFEASLQQQPTTLCYRNLAVFWNTEGEFKKAFGFATQAMNLNPEDPYNQVFYAIYLILDGQKERGEALIKKAQFDPSMAYNYACYYAAKGQDDLALKYLHRHFYGYEKFDDVRRFEMAEARMDLHFKKYKEDARFLEMTALAAK